MEGLTAGKVEGAELDLPAGLVRRIWDKDASVWGPGEDDPAERLGWLDLHHSMEPRLAELDDLAASVRSDGITSVVLLGMGGSSLAPEVFSKVLDPGGDAPSLTVLDSTHPDHIARICARLEREDPLFVVSSKSGGTVETMSLWRYLHEIYPSGHRYVAVTDPGTPLQELAAAHDFRACFLNPPDIGGRYSALSLFGLVPAALTGLPVRELLASAAVMAEACGPATTPEDNPGLVLGTFMASQADRGRDKLTFVLPERLAPFGDWVEQLIAESTGKQGKGVTPVTGEPATDPRRYGRDRAFIHLRVDGSPEGDDLAAALAAQGHPLLAMDVRSGSGLGAEMYRWEFATAVCGAMLRINAFDQPDVEAAKKAGRAVLEGGGDPSWDDGDPDALFSGVSEGDLACILAFSPYGDGEEKVIEAARAKLLEDTGVATLSGFGPRYLHSTGQLLKGGPPGVRALVVLAPPRQDLPIPGSDHGFSRLVVAQALGDVDALREAGREVVTVSWDTFAGWANG